MTDGEVTIRAAIPDDATDIVRVIRSGFAPSLLDLFIYGCFGVDRYVRAQIEADGSGCDTTFDVAVARGRIVGAIEMRALPDQLFLNYMAVAPDSRLMRLGTRLLRAAVERVAKPAHQVMALDVFDDNAVALHWYDALGFVKRSTTEWFILPLPEVEPAIPGHVSGAPQAAVCHDAFGFSRITVSTPSGSHEVGLLGTQWFRVTTRAALEDTALVTTLRIVAPDRRVLAGLPVGTLAPGAFPRARRIAESRRLTCDMDVLRACLRRRLADPNARAT